MAKPHRLQSRVHVQCCLEILAIWIQPSEQGCKHQGRSGDMPSLFTSFQDHSRVVHDVAPQWAAWLGDSKRGITE